MLFCRRLSVFRNPNEMSVLMNPVTPPTTPPKTTASPREIQSRPSDSQDRDGPTASIQKAAASKVFHSMYRPIAAVFAHISSRGTSLAATRGATDRTSSVG